MYIVSAPIHYVRTINRHPPPPSMRPRWALKETRADDTKFYERDHLNVPCNNHGVNNCEIVYVNPFVPGKLSKFNVAINLTHFFLNDFIYYP